MRDITRLLAASLACASLALITCADEAPTNAGPVQPAELAGVLAADDAPLLLDVRSPEEFAAGHVPGATLVPVGELESRLAELEAYKRRGVVAYCEVGGRAGKAADLLRASGFANVRLLEGSMQRWREEGREVATE